MKKSLIHATVGATLFAVTGAAFAAGITVYGRVNQGVLFENKKADNTTTRSVTMESGLSGASLWGIKGESDPIAQGWKVSFGLEGKLLTDSGAMGGADDGRLFDRDSYLELSSPYGTVRVGRMGYLHGGVSGGIAAGISNPFGVVYKQCGAQNVLIQAASRTDNAVSYKSPKMAGFQLAAMWSNANDDTTESSALPNRERYLGVGANYANGPFKASLVYGQRCFPNNASGAKGKYKDEKSITLTGNYNFGPATLYGGFQHVDNVNTKIVDTNVVGGDSTNVILGVSTPCAGGTLMFATAYVKGKKGISTVDSQKTYQFGLGYKYSFSKKVMGYVAASYRHAKVVKATESKTKTTQVMSGLAVSF